VFKIPPSLVLPEDRVHGDPECSDEAVAALNDRIRAVTDRIIAVRGTCQIVFHVMSENVWLVHFLGMCGKRYRWIRLKHGIGAESSLTC